MKKIVFAISMALVIGFTAAVGLCVKTLYAPKSVAATENELLIVLDAGHGGIDGGVTGKKTGVKESDLNLAIVYRLKSRLEDIGFEVVLTRKTEAGLYGTAGKGFKKRDMQKRKEIIQNADPALVLSIHQNLYPSKNTRGGQVFYSKKTESGKTLALILQEKINELYSEEKVKARKAVAGDFFMLECSDCPSVIVECGFLSNEADEALLSSGAWQEKLADTISGGVLRYFANLSA